MFNLKSKIMNEETLFDENFWTQLEETKTKNKKNPKPLNEAHNMLLERIEQTFTENYKDIVVGQIVTGFIEKIDRREIVININYKDSVYVSNKVGDLRIIENLKVGDEIDVMISEINDNPYEIKGSITELIRMKVATKLKKYFKTNEVLIAKVTEIIPAGFMIDIDMDNITITAFMPNTLAGINRLTEQQNKELVGQRIAVMLETLQQEKGVYVVSRKKYLQTLIPEQIKKLNKETVYQGVVTGTKDFGVFVEFNGCLTGMIHKLNLHPDWQNRICDIKSGMGIEFYVRDVIKGNKIILTQIATESLWDKIRVGKFYDGTVKDIRDFGALVELDYETNGLIQNSNLQKTGAKLTIGEKIRVKVVSLMKDERKIYLNIA
jgi:ribosomal protein S1